MNKSLLIVFLFLIKSLSAQELDKKFYLLEGLKRETINETDFQTLNNELKLYHEAKHDTSKFMHLNEFVETCNDEKIWRRYNIFMLEEIEKKRSNTTGRVKYIFEKFKANAINNIGYFYMNYTNRNDSALYFFNKSLKINEAINAWDNLIVNYSNIANVYQLKGEYVKAIELYNNVLKIESKTENKSGLFSSINNLANIYIFLGDTAKATEYLLKCFDLAIRYKKEPIKASLLHNLGMLKGKQGFYNEALQALKTSLSIRKKLGDKRAYANTLISIASIMILKGDAASAAKYLNEAKQYTESIINTPTQKGNYYKALGELQVHLQNNKAEGFENYRKAIAIYEASENYSEVIQTISGALPSVSKDPAFKHIKLELIEKLYEYGKIIDKKSAQDNLVKAKYENEIQLIEAEFKTQQKIKDENVKNEKRIQQSVTIAVTFILLITLFFSYFILKALKANKEKTALIHEQKLKVEHQNELLAEKQKEIIDSINYAKRIQDAYLPPEKVFNTLFEKAFVLFQPKDIVSGDFYWFYNPRNSQNDFENFIFCAVADCTGHGVPGAIMSVICCNALNEVVVNNKIHETDEILNKVRIIVKRNLKNSENQYTNDGMDISLCRINKETNEISFSGANNPLLIISNSGITELKANKQPIGNYAHELPFTKTNFQLMKGDMIYMFSDGYADQFGGSSVNGLGKKLKYANFKKILLANFSKTAPEQKQALLEYFMNWKGHIEQTDDVCVMGIRI
jgi:serine phosphatase RsbU (regulator of sigma subunit)